MFSTKNSDLLVMVTYRLFPDATEGSTTNWEPWKLNPKKKKILFGWNKKQN